MLRIQTRVHQSTANFNHDQASFRNVAIAFALTS